MSSSQKVQGWGLGCMVWASDVKFSEGPGFLGFRVYGLGFRCQVFRRSRVLWGLGCMV